MIIARSESPRWQSNTYLVAEGPGAPACFVDAGGPVAPLLERAEREGLEPTHVLLTHRHHDHVAELAELQAAHPGIAVLAHPLERSAVPAATGDLVPGEAIEVGALRVEVLHAPGHTAGMVALLVDGTELFTGDTLFRGSVGGVRASGATSARDLRASVLDVLLARSPEVRIHPGHAEPTSVGQELVSNPIVRVWRRDDPALDEPCVALGEPATLLAWAEDYDGGHKALLRWPDGREDVLAGSRVERRSA